ncbi:hypothetical protein BVH03_07895 [Pseudomonas sp. PA15(2017)]|nr:hypothetical protein BVH03_07895 [Pseudomonas sp. PA15(2017)]
MMKTQYVVETCTFHGPSKQRRWHRVHTGPSLMDCNAYVGSTIASMYAHWRPERALALFRVRGVRTSA